MHLGNKNTDFKEASPINHKINITVNYSKGGTEGVGIWIKVDLIL